GAAGIIAMDVIEAVADAELIVSTELMIHLCEKVCVMNRVRINAGGDLRPDISDGCEPSVDRIHIRGRDGDESALIQLALLEVPKVKRAVANHRPAETDAVLSLRGGKRCVGKGIGG